MVSVSPLLLPEPPLSLPPPQAVSARAVIAMPAVAASARRPPLEREVIRYLVFMGADRGRDRRRRGRPWLMCGCMPSTHVFRSSRLASWLLCGRDHGGRGFLGGFSGGGGWGGWP